MVTSSAAPWEGGVLPSFTAFNASAANTIVVNDSAAVPQVDEDQQQQQQQQQHAEQNHFLPPLPNPPPLKRRLQPDHCKDALEDALHSQKQRRLQMTEGSGDGSFRHASQRRKNSEYAGLAPSSRSTKHPLSPADAQLYKKRTAQSPQKKKKKDKKRSLASEVLTEAHDQAVQQGEGGKQQKQRPKRPSAAGSPSSRSPSAHNTRKGPSSTSELTPNISPSPDGSPSRQRERDDDDGTVDAPPTPAMALPTALGQQEPNSQQRRPHDSFLVHLHTPEVLPPTTPQKKKQVISLSSSPSPRIAAEEKESGLLEDILTPVSLVSHRRTSEDATDQQLALSPSQAAAAASPSQKRPSLLQTPSTTPSPQKGRLPSFRRINSRVRLTAPAEEAERKQGRAGVNAGKRNSARGQRAGGRKGEEASGEEKEGEETPRHHRSISRMSSFKTLSIVWAKRPHQPTSASHRALQQRQKKTTEAGSSGRPVQWRTPQKKGAGARGTASRSTPSSPQRGSALDGEVAGEDGEAAVKEDESPAADASPGAHRKEEGNSASPAAAATKQRLSRLSWRQRPSPKQQQQRQQAEASAHARERLPQLPVTQRNSGSGSGDAAAAAALMGSVPAGFGAPSRPSYSRNDVGGRRHSRRTNSLSSPRGSTDRSSGDAAAHTSEDIFLPQLAHTAKASERQHNTELEDEAAQLQQNTALTLEAVLARYLNTSHGGAATRNSPPAVGLSHINATTAAPQPRLSTAGAVGEYHDGQNDTAGEVGGTTRRASSGGQQPLLPSLPARETHKGGGATKTNYRRSWKPSPTSNSASGEKEKVATVVQKFAPLVVPSTRSLFTSVRHGGPFGHSTNAKTLGESEKTKTRDKGDTDGCGATSHEDPPEDREGEEGQPVTLQLYPSVQPTRSAPQNSAGLENDVAEKGKATKDDKALTPPRKPRVPRAPHPPSTTKRKKAQQQQQQRLVGYAFAPYMAGMRYVPGGQARYNPTIAHRPYEAGPNTGRKGPGNKKAVKKKREEVRPVKPAPIDYAALATERDPLDYLLGRHGFWGETTNR